METQKIECLIGDLFEGNNVSKVPTLFEIKEAKVNLVNFKSNLFVDYFSSSFLRIYLQSFEKQKSSVESKSEISKTTIESFIVRKVKQEKRKTISELHKSLTANFKNISISIIELKAILENLHERDCVEIESDIIVFK